MNKFDFVDVEASRTQESSGPNSTQVHTVGVFALVVVVAMTVLLVAGIMVDNKKVALAFLCGVGFFSPFVVLVVLAFTGQLGLIATSGQRERTIRERDRMQYDLHLRSLPTLQVVQPAQLPAPPTMELPALTTNFVAAVPAAEELVKADSYSFVYKLYKNGELDRDRVLGPTTKRPGKIQLKKERPEVMNYLMALGIVWEDEDHMIYFNESLYQSMIDCKLAIRSGVPKGATE